MKNFRKAFLVLTILSIFSFEVFASTEIAIVNSVVGKVEIQINDSWVQVQNGDVLASGTVISTGFRSSAVLHIGESLIEVRALTRLTIEEIKEQNQNFNTTMFLDAGNIKADIKKSENKRVGFKVRTSVATASVRGTSGEIYSDGTLICLSGKWAITPPEPKGMKTNSLSSNQNVQEKQDNNIQENIEIAEQDTQEAVDQDFYDAIDNGAFIVTENQTITINTDGKVVPPHEIAHSQSTNVGALDSENILENNSDLRITSPIQNSDKTVNNKGKNITTVDVTITVK